MDRKDASLDGELEHLLREDSVPPEAVEHPKVLQDVFADKEEVPEHLDVEEMAKRLD